VPTAAIKTQCAADYYYGHEQDIETELGRLEAAFSAAIGDLSIDTIEGMSSENLAAVKAFVHVQAERTPFAGQVQRNAYVNLGQQLYSAYAKANQLADDDGHREAERFADRQMPSPGAHTVDLAVTHQAAIDDLDVKFVMANGFMISDHPALSMNLWRDEHPRFRTWPHLVVLSRRGSCTLCPLPRTGLR
jgi:hypothetical protein